MSIDPIIEATQRYLDERANVQRIHDYTVDHPTPVSVTLTLHTLTSGRDSVIFTSQWEIQLLVACLNSILGIAAERMHAARADVEALLK